jgi:pimeloyl-ACP methyl ester carboxylesterase
LSNRTQRNLAKWELAALALAGAAGTLALANKLAALASGEPYSALTGESGRYAWEHGAIAYTVKGQGEPLVLVHGIYAGASSYEFRRVFDALAQDFRVYAVDLLGFGLSTRPAIDYTPALYQGLIRDFVNQVVGGVDHPAHVVASSLSAAFVIRAAAERPDLLARLVLVEPTGLENLASRGNALLRALANRGLRSPLVGQGIYNLITSRPSIRYFLKSQTYGDPALASDDVVDYYYTTAHQPGGRYAVAAFISGMLNTPVAAVYPLLRQPILLCWGKDARFAPLENAAAFRKANPRAELRVFDCGSLPQDEKAGEFASEVRAWLKSGSRSTSRG